MPACRSRPSAPAALRPGARRSSGRSRAGGCTGPPAPCSSPTRRRSRVRRGVLLGLRRRARRRFRDDEQSPPADERPAERDALAGAARPRGRRAAAGDDEATTRSRSRWRWPATRSCSATERFDALEPGELAQLYRLMARPGARDAARRTRRYERGAAAARSTCGGRCAAACARRRSDPARAAAGAASSAAGSCCSATSPARWSPTRAPTSSS